MWKNLLLLLVISSLCACDGNGNDADDDAAGDDDSGDDDDAGDDDSDDDDNSGDDDSGDDDSGDDDSGPACTHYVSTNGVDSPKLGDIDNPWRTISYGTERVEAGDTLCIRGGTYTGEGSIEIEHSGSPGNWITIRNYEDEDVILEYPDDPDELSEIKIDKKSHIRIQGIKKIHGGKGMYIKGDFSGLVHDIEILDCTFDRPFQSALHMTGGMENVLIDGVMINDVSDHHSSNGINLLTSHLETGSDYMMENITIRNTTIDGVGDHNGINFGPVGGWGEDFFDVLLMHDITIENCDISNVNDVGIFCNHVTVYELHLNNCVIHDSSRAAALTIVDSTIENNEVYDITNYPLYAWLYNGTNDNCTFRDNYVHGCGDYAIIIEKASNMSIINTTQKGCSGHVQFKNLSGGDNYKVIDHVDGATVRMNPSNDSDTVIFQFTDGRDFEVDGGGNTEQAWHLLKDGSSEIIMSTDSDRTWTIIHDGSPVP